MREVQKGDIVRVRRMDSSDDWCVCVVELVSHNGLSICLNVQDGALRTKTGGIVTSFLPVSVTDRCAYEVASMTPLEIDLWEPSPQHVN